MSLEPSRPGTSGRRIARGIALALLSTVISYALKGGFLFVTLNAQGFKVCICV